jgi:DNA polymerase III gamma/tau subunit
VRDYGRIYSTFWTSPDIRVLSDDGKLLAAYLLTGPHGTIAGAFRLPPGYVSDDLRWSPKRVAKGFEELSRKGFSARCPVTNWCVILRFLDWNRPENHNQWLAVHRIIKLIPKDCAWRAEFMADFAVRLPQRSARRGNSSETVAKEFRNQEQEQEQEQHQKQEQESSPTATLSRAPTETKTPTKTPTETRTENGGLAPSEWAMSEALKDRCDILPDDLLHNWQRWARGRRTPVTNVDAAFLTWASKHEPSATQRRHAIAATHERTRPGLHPLSEVLARATTKPSS